MKIRLKSFNFDILKTVGHDEIDLEADAAILKTLLQKLTQNSEGKLDFFVDPQSDRILANGHEAAILVNKREFRTVPKGLEAELKDGDEVEIILLHVLEGG